MQQTDHWESQFAGSDLKENCELRSLKFFLAKRSRAQLERCSERIVDVIRERDIPVDVHRRMTFYLDRLKGVSRLTFFNALLAKAIYVGETEDVEEKVRLIEEFLELAETPLDQRACLEVICRLILNCITMDLPPRVKNRFPFSFLVLMAHPNGSATIRELCAGGLFNLFFQLGSLEEEKVFLERFIDVSRVFMHEERVVNLLLKTLVNYSYKIRETEEKRRLLGVMREFAAIPSTGDENQLVYAKGLSNYIMFLDAEAMDEKLRKLEELRQMIQGERFWNYAETYVHTLFKTAIDTEDLEIKRAFFRGYQSILSIRNDGPAAFREAAAQFLFNHFVDVQEIEEKRSVMEEMQFLWKMDGNDENVAREMARLLVNLIIDDPDEVEKRKHFALMEKIAADFPENPEILLEYAKALVNFSICDSPVNEKLEFLKKLFVLRGKMVSGAIRKPQSETMTDFLCIYAQGILIFVSLVKDETQRLECVQQLPPFAKFRESLFADVFRSVLRDLLRTELEPPVRRILEEYMQEAKH